MTNPGRVEQLSVDSPHAGDAQPAGCFRWLAEWEPHEATWIAWPHNLETWPNRFENIPATFERLIRILSDVERVQVLGGPDAAYRQAFETLQDCENVTVHPVSTNDCWIRDYGPTFINDRRTNAVSCVHWRFNSWGGKYPPFDEDAVNGARMAEIAKTPCYRSELICEGGGIETDGEGTLLTTSRCLLSMSRNPDWKRDEVEGELRRRLGIEKVVWVDGGELAGDDTDSHIDQLVRFIRPGLVVAAVSYSSDDENASKLETQWECISHASDAKGRRLDVVKLPTPPPRFIQGCRVPESYCNFYLANGIAVVPIFGFRETDEQAVGILEDLMPERRIVRLDCSDLIWGRGAIHCVTQQQPASESLERLTGAVT